MLPSCSLCYKNRLQSTRTKKFIQILKRAKTTTTVAASTASTESDCEIPYTPNEENLDSIVNDLT